LVASLGGMTKVLGLSNGVAIRIQRGTSKTTSPKREENNPYRHITRILERNY